MEEVNKTVFIGLFKEAYEKCFGVSLVSPLSEADCKLLANTIFEKTGLVIGAKSIKNYSLYVLGGNHKAKKENPSYATLDTLARYVLDAPYTSEIQRKENENHFPYWFQYRSKFSIVKPKRFSYRIISGKAKSILYSISVIIIGTLVITFILRENDEEYFTDNFTEISEDSLISNGWILKSEDTIWWNRRKDKTGHITLFTLKGDNWPLNENNAHIPNLLMREIHSDCFSVEVHLTDFFPSKNWQQAGILLSEDSTFTGKMIRLTISYNDFFGGYKNPPEITIQEVNSSETGSHSKPEFTYKTIFSIPQGSDSLVKNNLKRSALKIEKHGKQFRFLYISSPVESFAFQEAAAKVLNMHPKYVSIFAIQGWTDSTNIVPVYFDSFTISGNRCD